MTSSRMQSLPRAGWVLWLGPVTGCGPKDDEPVAEADTDTDTDTDPVGAIAGQITWDVDYDTEREAAGKTDCTYTRTYAGITDASAPWLCPDCAVAFRAEVEVDGLPCYTALTGEDPEPVEWLGFGGGTFYRGSMENAPFADLGSAIETDGAFSVSWESDATDPYGAILTASGTLTVGEGEGDPMHGYAPPASYACGWPKADPPPFEGAWAVAMGEPLPDGWFEDTCGESVRLHDFQGKYLVIDISAVDCPPCQDMAAEEHAWLESIRGQGYDVEVITLLAPSLSAVLDPTPQSTLEDWSSNFGIESPVLGDRGWGYVMGTGLLGEGFGYPTWFLVSPDLEVLDGGTGFGGGSTFPAIGEAIEAHAG